MLRPAGLAIEKNGNLIVVDSGNNRLQVFSPDGKFVAKCGGPGKNPGEFNQPWGITLDKDGNIYVADWKNHRIQKLSPAGKPLMCLGSYGKITEPENSYAVTTLGPFVSGESEKAGQPRTDQFNHPTDVAVDSDGDIYVCDWGNHRICVFDSEGGPVTTLIGDAHELSKWGKQSVDANPDMMKARRRVKSLEPSWRFCFPTAVDFDPAERPADRRRQPAQPAAGLQQGPRLHRLPSEPVDPTKRGFDRGDARPHGRASFFRASEAL